MVRVNNITELSHTTMPFEPTPELINEMILFESQMDYHSYPEYQAKMIQQFYQYYDKDHPNYERNIHYRADIDTINQLTEWAKYPTCKFITLDHLKKIEMKIVQEWMKQPNYMWPERGLGVDQKTYLDRLIASYGYGTNGNNLSNSGFNWNQLLRSVEDGQCYFGRVGRSTGHIDMHVRFVDIIRSIWNSNKHQPISTESISYVQYNQLKQTIDDLQQQLTLANQKIAMLTSEFHFEFNLLKQQNAELRCRRNGYPIAMAVPVAASAPVDLNDTKVHLARSISTQNLSEYQDQ